MAIHRTHCLGGSGTDRRGYLEVHFTYNLISNCSYNLIISPISTVTLDKIQKAITTVTK